MLRILYYLNPFTYWRIIFGDNPSKQIWSSIPKSRSDGIKHDMFGVSYYWINKEPNHGVIYNIMTRQIIFQNKADTDLTRDCWLHHINEMNNPPLHDSEIFEAHEEERQLLFNSRNCKYIIDE